MDNTWLNPVTNSSWPELIKGDRELEQFDVFVYGYASPAMGNASTISQISTRFLQQLKDFEFFSNYVEIDFITHSMGGIITKRTLDMLNTPSDSPLLQKVHTVIYISVPSNGADLGALASWISQNPQFKGMDPKNASDFLHGVEDDWANLLRQRSAESPLPRTYSAYETLATGPVVVVPQLYTSELSDERVIGFDYNHIDIVKPKDRSAEVYLWTKARLLEKGAESRAAESHAKVDRTSGDRMRFNVSGSFDLGYSIAPGSWVMVDTRTGIQVDAKITVIGPDGKADVFSNQAVYQTPTTWGWQGQGSSGGSLDFTDQDPFVRYPGGVLSHSAYNTPSLGHIITSSNTTLAPVASHGSAWGARAVAAAARIMRPSTTGQRGVLPPRSWRLWRATKYTRINKPAAEIAISTSQLRRAPKVKA